MEDVRVLLLRGESGAGKTVALHQEAERLRNVGKGVAFADLADGLVDVQLLLGGLAEREYPTVIIDGLDEALARDPTLDVVLRRAISKIEDAPEVRLRLAVRSAFVVDRLAALLTDRFSAGFEDLALASLRAEDVMIAARAEGIDPNAFLSAVEGLRVAPLAARPPTLKMLLRLWKADGHLPKRRQDMYQQGSAVLLREANAGRVAAFGGNDPALTGRLGTADRIAVATRIAALLTFGGYERVDLGAEPSGEGLHVDAVVGGVEQTPSGEVAITAGAVREVVGTSLFRPAGTAGFGFAHPSFGRFLAATYLTGRGMSPEQTLPLLETPDGRIGANRIEVASWLGALDAAHFQRLAQADPQVLLRSGIPAERAEQRLDLAQALISVGAAGGVDVKELEATGDLVLVSAPGLEQMLAPIIGDKAQAPGRRAFAARMAADTGCVPITECMDVALDGGEAIHLRRAAVRALAAKPDEAREALLSLADDPDEGLRLAALGIAMRRLLSPAEVIRRLKPGPRLGMQSFLVLELLRSLDPASLPEALEAIADVAIRGVAGERGDHLTVAQSVAARAFFYLDNMAIREALAMFIARFPAVEPWLRWSFPLHKRGLPAVVTAELRQALVSAVVVCASDNVGAARNLLEACFLLRNEDLPWLVKEALAALGVPQEAIWSTLATEVARGCGGAPYGHLRAEGASDRDVYRIAAAGWVMPRDFDRWTPPHDWDPFRQEFDREEKEEVVGDDGEDEYVEPIGNAIVDWQLLTIQTAAGGRADAPSVDPATLLSLARRSDARLVLGDRDLLHVVVESFGRLRQRLKGRDPLVRALWDEGSTMVPKDENFLSDFIVDHLRQDLVRGAIVADREVQLRSRLHDTPGQRTDIQVQAFTGAWAEGGRRSVASLTIEVKGCWNKDLYTAMQSQLVDRYLASTREVVGLYVVGWYVCAQWRSQRVAGRKPAAGTTIASLLRALEAQADSLSGADRRIEVAVIDATLT